MNLKWSENSGTNIYRDMTSSDAWFDHDSRPYQIQTMAKLTQEICMHSGKCY